MNSLFSSGPMPGGISDFAQTAATRGPSQTAQVSAFVVLCHNMLAVGEVLSQRHRASWVSGMLLGECTARVW